MKKLRTLLSVFIACLFLLSVLGGCVKDTESDAATNAQTSEATSTPAEADEPGTVEVKWSEEVTADGWVKVTNEGGETLGYSKDSGVTLIQVDGFAFKDLNQNGVLDQYEDWRLDDDVRTANLVSLMASEDIIPLFMEFLDAGSGYATFSTDMADAMGLNAIELIDYGVRTVHNLAAATVDGCVTYTNAEQAYVEGKGYGIPIDVITETGSSLGSSWPTQLGIAATFDPEIAAEYGRIASIEWRVQGSTQTNTPHIDLATEPRWSRVITTFGEDPALVKDMAVAYVNAQQSTYAEDGTDLGWGSDSLAAILKHWPGDSPAEGGRESHSDAGKYNVYPGDQFYTQLIPFVSCFDLPGLTGSAAGVMPSYSIRIKTDGTPMGENVGTAFNAFMVEELLGDYDFEGFSLTDYRITNYLPWGVEDLTMAERYLKIIEAGCDMVGHGYDYEALKEAIVLYTDKYGEEGTRTRLEETATRVLKYKFYMGMFENPYQLSSESSKIVGSEENQAIAYEAQLKSFVMLKNSGNLLQSSTEKATVYIPMKYAAAEMNYLTGMMSQASWKLPVNIDILNQYFNVVTDKVSDAWTGPEDEEGKATLSINDIVRASDEEIAACDYSIVVIDSPKNPGGGVDHETGEYVPISLQYGEYIADSSSVRQTSLSGNLTTTTTEGNYAKQTVTEKENRSYYGKSAQVSNASDLALVLDVAAKSEKVMVVVNISNPMVFSEFESEVDTIILNFGAANWMTPMHNIDKALCEIISGNAEPSGLLPMQMPLNMETVEAQYEDVPRDMECYVDAEGNTYDFAFGLNWSGVISDERTAKYDVPPIVG